MNAELQSGSTLGPYELLTRLGRGGMASVWVARERAPKGGRVRLVAVKAMLPELARHSDFRAMFLEEGQIVRAIDHPNVVKVHEVSEDNGILYMAMDWIEGESLRALIKEAKRRRAIPVEMAVKIIADTAAGLHAAHELRGWDGELRNIVHCDVSPHNILVGLDGSVKLVDFGVANAAAHSVMDAEYKIKGKFGYMSPEQASAAQVDRRSDVFALGIVLFELTTGERLFRGDDPAHTLELVKSGVIRSPQEVFPEYPDGLAKILKRALSRNANQRFQTAAEFRDALEQYLKHERIVVSHASVGQLVRRVLGTRIEQQRQTLREALLLADGTVKTELLPDRGNSGDHTSSSVPRFTSPSEPPTSPSQLSTSRTGTPRPQILDRGQMRKAELLPLFAAIGGLAAAAGAILWVTHRPGPTPLISNTLIAPTISLANGDATRSNSADPQGVNVDTLPIASAVLPSAATQRKPARIESPSPVDQSPSGATRPEAASSAASAPADSADSTTAPASAERAALNRAAALAALNSAADVSRGCKRADGPTGSGTARVTFAPDGTVQLVNLAPPFAGTAVGQCISTAFRDARLPPFSGGSLTLPQNFRIPD